MEENDYYDEGSGQGDPSVFEDIQSEEYVEETRLIEEVLREKALSQARDFNKWGLAIRYIYEGLLSTNYQNFVNFDNNTLLHYAVYYQEIQIIDFLLLRGANPNLRNNYDETPLLWAENNKIDENNEAGLKTKQNIINLLVRHGAQADERDEVRTNPITAVGGRNRSHKRKKGKERERDSAQENERQGYGTSTTNKIPRRDKKGKEKADREYEEKSKGKIGGTGRSSLIIDALAKPHNKRDVFELEILKQLLNDPREIEATLTEYREKIKSILGNDVPIDSLEYLFGNLENVKLSPAISKPQNNYISEYLPLIIKILEKDSKSEEDKQKIYAFIKDIFEFSKDKLKEIINHYAKDSNFRELMETISAIKTIHAMQEVAIKVRDVYKNSQLGIIDNLNLIEEFIAIMENDGLPAIKERIVKHKKDRDFAKPRISQNDRKRFAGHLSQIAYTARSWAQGDLLDIESPTIRVYPHIKTDIPIPLHVDVAKPAKLVEIKHFKAGGTISEFGPSKKPRNSEGSKTLEISEKGEAFEFSNLGEILNYVIPAIEQKKHLQILLTNPVGKNEQLVTEMIPLSILFPNGFSIKMPIGTIGNTDIQRLKSQGLILEKLKDNGRYIVLRVKNLLSESEKEGLMDLISKSKDSADIRPSASGAPFRIQQEHFLEYVHNLLKKTFLTNIKHHQRDIYEKYIQALHNSAQFFNPYASTSASQSPVTSSQLPFPQSSLRPGIGVQPKLSSIAPGPSQLVNIPREIFPDPLTAAAQVQPFPSLGASTSQAPTTRNQPVSPLTTPRSIPTNVSSGVAPAPFQPVLAPPHLQNNNGRGNNISIKPTLTDLGQSVYPPSFPTPTAFSSSNRFAGMFPSSSASTSNNSNAPISNTFIQPVSMSSSTASTQESQGKSEDKTTKGIFTLRRK